MPVIPAKRLEVWLGHIPRFFLVSILGSFRVKRPLNGRENLDLVQWICLGRCLLEYPTLGLHSSDLIRTID